MKTKIEFEKDTIDLIKKLLFVASQNLDDKHDYDPADQLDKEGVRGLVQQARELLSTQQNQ